MLWPEIFHAGRRMNMSRRRFGAFWLAASLAAFAGFHSQQVAATGLATETLTVNTASGQHKFEVEIARTEGRRGADAPSLSPRTVA